MSSAEADALRVRVKAQSEKIRQMKKAGSAQEEITSEVQMLQLMKADLEKMASAAQGIAKWQVDREKLDDCLLQRMFVVPAFEIYNGVAGLYDFGPAGCAFKENLLALWRQHFVLAEKMLQVECTTLTPHEVLDASGHVALFADKMVKDPGSGECFRADKLLEDRVDLLLRKDPMMDSEERERLMRIARQADAWSLDELHAYFGELGIKSPTTGNTLSKPFPFNLMFSTSIGPAGNMPGFLRPETAQGIFVNFKRLVTFNGGRVPFAAAQIGLAYRNEISPRGGLIRVREFTMGEIEHFCDPENKRHAKFGTVAGTVMTLFTQEGQVGTGQTIDMTIGEAVAAKIVDNETLGYYMARTQAFLLRAGVNRAGLRFRQHLKSERAHYATDCWDAEILMSTGWVECVGHADRGDYDLKVHAGRANVDMTASRRLPEPKTITIATPKINKGVLGKTFKADGSLLIAHLEKVAESVAAAAALEDQLATSGSAVVNVNGKDFTLERGMVSYTLSPKTVTVESFVPHVVEPSFGIGRIMTGILEHCFSVRPGAEERRVLSFPAVVAPVKCSLLPLDGRVSDAAVAMVAAVLDEHNISYVLDDSGTSIGKRYARTDEIGIPFALTVEISTPETGTVTLRDRDSCAQVVVPVAEVGLLITSLCSGRASWTDMTARYTNLEASEKASAVGGGAGGAESSTPAAASKDSAVVVEGRDRMYGRFSRPKVSIL